MWCISELFRGCCCLCLWDVLVDFSLYCFCAAVCNHVQFSRYSLGCEFYLGGRLQGVLRWVWRESLGSRRIGHTVIGGWVAVLGLAVRAFPILRRPRWDFLPSLPLSPSLYPYIFLQHFTSHTYCIPSYTSASPSLSLFSLSYRPSSCLSAPPSPVLPPLSL